MSLLKSYLFGETLGYKMTLSSPVSHYHIHLFISFIDLNLIWNYGMSLFVDYYLSFPVSPLERGLHNKKSAGIQ